MTPRPRRFAAAALAALLTGVLLMATAALSRAQGGSSLAPSRGRAFGSAGTSGAGGITYLRDCAWCHGAAGDGTTNGPSLIGVGTASVDFMLSTGRMPIPEPEEQPQRRPPSYSPAQIAALVEFLTRYVEGGPDIPSVDPSAGVLGRGEDLYQQNCAACHSSSGVGGALTNGLIAPSLHDSTPRQIAEAMRVGGAGYRNGHMPKFGPEIFDADGQRLILPIQESKGKRKSRVVYLPPEALAIVQRLAEQYPDGKLFRNSKGRPFDRNSVRCRFRRIKRELGIPELTATTLRHSFAHWRLTSGQDSLTVAKLLGHVDTRMIATRYGHLEANPEFMQGAANAISFPVPLDMPPSPTS